MRSWKILACSLVLGFAAASMAFNAGAAPASGSSATRANSSSPSGAPSPAAPGSATSGIPAGAEWAAWINRDVEIPLQSLPRDYSCDALWYKLHAILLAIGAREYMSIKTYNCGSKAANGGRSPTLDLRFQTLRPVTGKLARWANTRAIHQTVTLAPGEPKRLDAGDCALVEQLQGTLFAYLGTKVDASRFECSGSPSMHDFRMTVQVLERWPNPLASASDPRARPSSGALRR